MSKLLTITAILALSTLAQAETEYIVGPLPAKTGTKADAIRALVKDGKAEVWECKQKDLNEKKVTLSNKD